MRGPVSGIIPFVLEDLRTSSQHMRPGKIKPRMHCTSVRSDKGSKYFILTCSQGAVASPVEVCSSLSDHVPPQPITDQPPTTVLNDVTDASCLSRLLRVDVLCEKHRARGGPANSPQGWAACTGPDRGLQAELILFLLAHSSRQLSC